MKKIYNILMAAAIALGTFTSCEDVPMPFNNPLDYLEPDPDEVVVEPAGDGTKDSPFNVAAVLNYINTLEADVKSDKNVYIKGVVKLVKEQFGTQYGNATFDISDNEEGSNTFTCYQVYYFNNAKYTAKNESNNDIIVNEGDVVVVCGKVLNFRGSTPETQAREAYVVSINGKSLEPAEEEVIGSIDNPQSVTQAVSVINALSDGGTTDASYYVKGTIKQIKTSDANIAQYKNIDYVITDGTSDMTVFRGKNIDNTDFTAAGQINVGDEVIVLGKLTKYINNGNVIPEIAQGNYIVKLTKGNGNSETGDPKGSGTLADPYNAAGANKFIKSLAADTESANDVYIKGKIVKFANKGEFENSGTYGNSTFYISDDGKESSEQFYVFRTLYFGNVQWTSGVTPKVGDEVIICGKVIYYQGKTPETAGNKSYLYSLNGKTDGGGGGSTSDVGSIDKPKTCTEALTIINALEDGAKTDEAYYVKGKITKIVTAEDQIAQFKNIDYWISDGTSEIEVFRGKNLDNTDFTGPGQINVNDEVIVLGKLQKYIKNGEMIPEMAQGNYIVKLTKGSSGDNGGGEQGELGSYSKPYSVASGIAAQGTEFKNIKDIYVKGYIVGWVEGQKLEEGAHFNANATVKSNILIADAANETDLSKCMPVQLPNNDVRTGMNLQDHPEFYGKAVILYGELAKYFGAAGVKSVTYAESDGKTLGTKP